MNCTAFSNLLDACLDGTLSPEEQAQMEAHAAECADCAALLALRRDCRELDQAVEVPAAFSAAWREAVHREVEPRRSRFSWRGILTAAAAFVFVVGGTLATRSSLRIQAPEAKQPALETPSARKESAQDAALFSGSLTAFQDAAVPLATGLPTAAARGTASPTALPALETAQEEASAAADVPGMKTAASAAVTNVQFTGMADMEESQVTAAAEESVPMEAMWLEDLLPAAEDAAYDWDAETYDLGEEAPGEEALGEEALEEDSVPALEEEAVAAAGEANTPAPAESEAQEPKSTVREIGLLLMCALPWIAAAAAVLLLLKRKEKRKTQSEGKE